MKQVTKSRGRHAVFDNPTDRHRRLRAGIIVGSLAAACLAIAAFALLTSGGAPATPLPSATSRHSGATPRNDEPDLKQKSPAPDERPTVTASRDLTASSAPSPRPTTTPTTTPTTPSPGHHRHFPRPPWPTRRAW